LCANNIVEWIQDRIKRIFDLLEAKVWHMPCECFKQKIEANKSQPEIAVSATITK